MRRPLIDLLLASDFRQRTGEGIAAVNIYRDDFYGTDDNDIHEKWNPIRSPRIT